MKKNISKKPFWRFIDDLGTFIAKDPHKISRLYFPLCSPNGVLSSITPTLHGDIKLGLHSFLTVPQSTEDLRDSRYNRNLWIMINNNSLWSAASGEVTNSYVEGGFLYHKLTRINKRSGLKVEFTNFAPISDDAVELELIKITNTSRKRLNIQPTIAIPIFARSADRLRDHRHVSSLLNRIKLHKNGVIVTPTMSFYEKGHKVNHTSYFVLGASGLGKTPLKIYPTIESFVGESGNLERPMSLIKDKSIDIKNMQGKEAIGALKFKNTLLSPDRSVYYIAIAGISQKKDPIQILKKYNSVQKIRSSLASTKKYWKNVVSSAKLSTKDNDFDRWVNWVMLQPTLRKIFGCSFLPDFDYGRGGRGWRDLWQDCLTLLLISPRDVRNILLNNFKGVRIDGSNATIIGKKLGEFIPDRNNIKRIWMDHGLWPFITLNLYINQTGDTGILFEKVGYFESKKKDTVLDHILLEIKRELSKISRHGNFLLEGGDWNDGLDMADKYGESVAFTAAYIGNMIELSNLLEKINYKKNTITWLRKKAEGLKKNINKNEWLTVKSGYSFFNGYYDNSSKKVEGNNKKGVRMTLTGQVFPIMSGVAEPIKIKKIYKSVKRYLWDKGLKGFRLNTDFKDIYPELGRAFSFAYGEKENGAFFSHMNVMFAYSLYKRAFVKEGFEVLNSIYNMSKNTKLSNIYPCLPEYFNSDGRGMYSYLTGSASWFMLTLITQVFGVRGDMGDLVIEPKLVKEQFKSSGTISLETSFLNRRLNITYRNPERLDFGEYRVLKVLINERIAKDTPIKKKTFLKLTSNRPINNIDVYLESQQKRV
ncbi:MAG: cellobiose phosphorylase [Candidatus Omnitrophota bacterium]